VKAMATALVQKILDDPQRRKERNQQQQTRGAVGDEEYHIFSTRSELNHWTTVRSCAFFSAWTETTIKIVHTSRLQGKCA
jgi:hypothetical protein